ncbi:hypothetical protein LTR95_011823 [Oleoguttula sp. CCFEE 5521]
MSKTSIELSTLARPDAVLTKSISIRRPSTTPTAASQFEQEDDVSVLALERVATAIGGSKTRTAAVYTSIVLTTGISALLSGLTTVILPTMAADLDIPQGLLLWPSSIQALTCGCSLLLSGSIADALGARFMYLLGVVLQSGFTLGCGLAQTTTQMIIFRGLSGIATAFCLPSAVSVITASFTGKRRDFAFAAMGGGQPIGFSIGLTLGGVLTDSIGWRWGYYLSAILNTIVLGISWWGLSSSIDNGIAGEGVASMSWAQKWQRVKTEIDWVGAVIASASLAMLSYVFAAITGSQSTIRQPSSIAMLVTAFVLIPAFIFWVGRQEHLGRPALIPNSLWRNKIFTTICLAVFLTWGTFNALETVLTFYFQDVQRLSATETSIRFLPAPISGAFSNVAMGLLVHRIPANWLVVVGCTLSLAAPLAMVFATPTSNYWSSGFLANLFNPNGADALYTISNLLITSVFPAKTQALAGGVFNTISQIGKSITMALVAVLAAQVTLQSDLREKHSPDALMVGYRATFWFMFACILATILLSVWGLRGIGTVGHKKRD